MQWARLWANLSWPSSGGQESPKLPRCTSWHHSWRGRWAWCSSKQSTYRSHGPAASETDPPPMLLPKHPQKIQQPSCETMDSSLNGTWNQKALEIVNGIEIQLSDLDCHTWKWAAALNMPVPLSQPRPRSPKAMSSRFHWCQAGINYS